MKRQQGVALITILVMVALATILAASIVKNQSNTAQNTGYLIRQNQSLLYAKSAEAFFSELLVQDAQNAAEADHPAEIWAQPMPPFPVEDGFVSGVLKDESGKFNLNNLVDAQDKVDENAKAWFEQLLVRVGLSPQLSEAVIDWQDRNDEVSGSAGAESSYYQGLSRPYLAANTKFHSVDELRMVRGFEGKNFDLIRPYVTALPSNAPTKVNINTASTLLLTSLDTSLNPAAVQNALQEKMSNMGYFKSVDELWTLDAFKGVSAENRNKFKNLLDVRSDYFRAYIEVLLSERKRQFTSDLVRINKKVYVYSRSLASVPKAAMD